MRVLVCGSRNFHDFNEVWNTLLAIHKKTPITLIITGGAPGADTLAGVFASLNRIEAKDFPADWKRYGRAAGPMRNKQMLEEGKPDLVVAFPKNGDLSATKGTRNMVEQARKAGVRVIVHGEEAKAKDGATSHG